MSDRTGIGKESKETLISYKRLESHDHPHPEELQCIKDNGSKILNCEVLKLWVTDFTKDYDKTNMQYKK